MVSQSNRLHAVQNAMALMGWLRRLRRAVFPMVEEEILVALRTTVRFNATPVTVVQGVVEWDETPTPTTLWSRTPWPRFTREVGEWIAETLKHPCGCEYEDTSLALRYHRHAIGDHAAVRIWFVSREDAMNFKLRWL